MTPAKTETDKEAVNKENLATACHHPEGARVGLAGDRNCLAELIIFPIFTLALPGQLLAATATSTIRLTFRDSGKGKWRSSLPT
jgi:hypothetical protein